MSKNEVSIARKATFEVVQGKKLPKLLRGDMLTLNGGTVLQFLEETSDHYIRAIWLEGPNPEGVIKAINGVEVS